MRAPLSDIHAMLATLRRERTPDFVNRLANDASIDRFVRGPVQGKLDLAAVIADPAVMALAGVHGAMLLRPNRPGCYEAHTMVLPEGRGAWALTFVRACLHWMFCRTDAAEVWSKTPRGNLAALAIARAAGLVYEFTDPRGWIVNGDLVPAGIHTIDLNTWMRSAEGLRERGRWFHDKLNSELKRFGKHVPVPADDDAQQRYAGAACEMLLGGQGGKAAAVYNRFAAMAGRRGIAIVDGDPLTIDIGSGWLIFRDDDFFMVSCMI